MIASQFLSQGNWIKTKTFLLTLELAPCFTIMMSLDLDQIDCRGNCHHHGIVDVAFPTWIMALFD